METGCPVYKNGEIPYCSDFNTCKECWSNVSGKDHPYKQPVMIQMVSDQLAELKPVIDSLVGAE